MFTRLLLCVLICTFIACDGVIASPQFRPSRTGRHLNPLEELVAKRQVKADDLRRGTPTRRQNCPVPLQSGICPDLLCSGVYVNPQTDFYNCGGCAKQCRVAQSTTESQAETCEGGTCGCYDPSFPTLCAYGCSDLDNDHYNCGECGHVCEDLSEGFICSNGLCVFEVCPTGEASCITGCTVLATDAENCGACGHACPAAQSTTESQAQTCEGGTCGCYDPSFPTLCPYGCSNLDNDHYNCGQCGYVCDDLSVGFICSNGVCGF
ncbi:hypothetical protein CALVIDRAFT_414325 [Calocera viscosa TUFC12733]|uniref:Uncharacterized protein n=1 Tax=Calocera viscosa (strain TUFC12733) TaxID=1330018 RepID=A0A167G1Q1_CALVF|nr:hypothetical protein CALVIDRAFT_414325 [Calocera viscosa TUFC12733]